MIVYIAAEILPTCHNVSDLGVTRVWTGETHFVTEIEQTDREAAENDGKVEP